MRDRDIEAGKCPGEHMHERALSSCVTGSKFDGASLLSLRGRCAHAQEHGLLSEAQFSEQRDRLAAACAAQGEAGARDRTEPGGGGGGRAGGALARRRRVAQIEDPV